MNKRIKFVNEAKFTDFLSENRIYKRQCMIFIIIALFSLFMHYNNFIKRSLNHLHKVKKSVLC